MIETEIHDDERRTQSTFDSTPWFEQASDDEIVALAKIGWGGDTEADQVGLFFEDDEIGTPCTVPSVFRTSMVLDVGYEVSINEEHARAWVQTNRPHLMEKI
jgi:hypothetical protein